MLNVILMYYTISYTDNIIYFGIRFSTKGDDLYQVSVDVNKLGVEIDFSITDNTDKYAIEMFKYFLQGIITKYCGKQDKWEYQVAKNLEPPTLTC